MPGTEKICIIKYYKCIIVTTVLVRESTILLELKSEMMLAIFVSHTKQMESRGKVPKERKKLYYALYLCM